MIQFTEMFLLIAYDFENSLERRMACRAEHVKLIDELREARKALIGAALTDEEGKMIGSTLMLDMNQAELDQYLKTEPFIINKIWEKWEIKTCSIGPSFIK